MGCYCAVSARASRLQRVYTKSVSVNDVTEKGENVLTSSIVVPKDAASVN